MKNTIDEKKELEYKKSISENEKQQDLIRNEKVKVEETIQTLEANLQYGFLKLSKLNDENYNDKKQLKIESQKKSYKHLLENSKGKINEIYNKCLNDLVIEQEVIHKN